MSPKDIRRRPLTPGEIDLARSVYGDAIDYARVALVRGKWAFFQPRNVVMAPRGAIHFHPAGDLWRDDFAAASLPDQGLFIHEMAHVWQHQRGLFLPLRRHPFCRYDYSFRPGVPLHRYGIEQQAEIVRHAFVLRRGGRVAGAPDLARYESVLPFGTAAR
ncbi:vgr related protein [uncultured Sphingomonas sp.]|uniref:vgr related protein n=1 Tax=uncultured Sphingomonas sp. TaxID=158754 RepID=UPI0035CB5C0C